MRSATGDRTFRMPLALRSLTSYFPSLPDLISSFSVRTRIVALALIPVAGFIANGGTFLSGETDVAAAFSSANRASALSDASRDYQRALADMRITARDFATAPKDESIKAFEDARGRASAKLDAVEGLLNGMQDVALEPLRARLKEIAHNFEMAIKEQRRLGF